MFLLTAVLTLNKFFMSHYYLVVKTTEIFNINNIVFIFSLVIKEKKKEELKKTFYEF